MRSLFLKSRRNCEKELSLVKQLKEQRDFYQEQYEKLRKLVDRYEAENPDSPRLKNIKEFISSQKQKEAKKALEEKWKCDKCELGRLKLIKIPQGPNLMYFRKCSNIKCQKKTRIKPYHNEVELS